MARPHKPWFRAPRDTWYVQIDGKQEPLARGKHNRAEAYEAMNRLLAARVQSADGDPRNSVVGLFGLFLGWTRRHRAAATYDQHRHFLKAFVRHPKLRSLRPHAVTVQHVEDWLDRHPGWNGSRRHAIRSLLRAFNWGVKRGLLGKNPIAAIEVPGKTRVVNYLSREQRLAVMASVRDRPFREFLTALLETGCRPGEVREVTAAQVNLPLGVWQIERHKTSTKTGKPRVVYLTAVMADLTRRLVADRPCGPLFLNRVGRPWTRNAVRIRFMRLRAKFPAFGRFTAYSFRKGYVTDALENGVGVAQVAELVGHTSTDMVMRHYAQLQERVGHMRAMAERAAGSQAK